VKSVLVDGSENLTGVIDEHSSERAEVQGPNQSIMTGPRSVTRMKAVGDAVGERLLVGFRPLHNG
jgi:hypothetical protein